MDYYTDSADQNKHYLRIIGDEEIFATSSRGAARSAPTRLQNGDFKSIPKTVSDWAQDSEEVRLQKPQNCQKLNPIPNPDPSRIPNPDPNQSGFPEGYAHAYLKRTSQKRSILDRLDQTLNGNAALAALAQPEWQNISKSPKTPAKLPVSHASQVAHTQKPSTQQKPFQKPKNHQERLSVSEIRKNLQNLKNHQNHQMAQAFKNALQK